MQWTIPGTIITADPAEAEKTEAMLEGLFLTGGISLGQVCRITGLEGYRIQNWVQRKYLSPPIEKKYSYNQLCRILTIQMLKDTMSMEKICSLLSYVNGKLDQEEDDLIEDKVLYLLFLRLAASVYTQSCRLEEAIGNAVAALPERIPGANEKIQTVLNIMLHAWCSGALRKQAEELMQSINL